MLALLYRCLLHFRAFCEADLWRREVEVERREVEVQHAREQAIQLMNLALYNSVCPRCEKAVWDDVSRSYEIVETLQRLDLGQEKNAVTIEAEH